MNKIIKGVKGFNSDMTCRNFKFEVNNEYKHYGKVEACSSGFHFCENPLDVFGYYNPAESKFCEVEGSGDISTDTDDSKVACSNLKIGAEISLHNLVDLGVKFILSKVDKKIKQINSKNGKISTNTEDYSASTNTGNHSASTNTGNYSASTNTGDRSASTNTGDRSASTNTGDHSASTNTGYYSASTNTGDRSASTNTGNYSASTNTGNYSASTNTGYRSASTVSGKESVAMAIGCESKAKGSLGCWIVISEWKEIKEVYHIIDVQCKLVDGKKIKADTFYSLKNGKFIEVK